MRGIAKALLSAAGLVVVYACDVPTVTFNPPPADTYTIGARQMKIDDSLTRVEAAVVTPAFFTATGIQPFLGRFITKGDEGASAAAAAVLSHDLWVARFGSAPSVIGQQIELDDQKFTVVGVAPRGFQFPGATLVWTSKAPGLVATAR
jgi:hypothetical protein